MNDWQPASPLELNHCLWRMLNQEEILLSFEFSFVFKWEFFCGVCNKVCWNESVRKFP